MNSADLTCIDDRLTSVSQIGVAKPSTACNPCPPGTFSAQPGSQECIKCPYGEYQNKSGQTKCLKCPEGHFSHKADKGCFPVRQCQASDYVALPDPISKCYLKDGKVIRKQRTFVPSWPGKYSSLPLSYLATVDN